MKFCDDLLVSSSGRCTTATRSKPADRRNIDTCVPKLAEGHEVVGINKSKNSSHVKKLKICVVFST